MQKMSDAQRRKIFKLKAEKGLDDDMLRSYVHTLVGKSSLKELTIRDAITVIDALEDKKQNAPGMISNKQQKYIQGLAVDYGWVGENKKVDMLRLNHWLKSKYGVNSIIWLTSKLASDAIEGLKAMIAREKEKQTHETTLENLNYAT